ncbi:MAG: ATP synthase F0 subunit B [Puniceicoccales bacterium]|nr:ATP synthase F0 subunit B [Puniceicoccales bacterium]
MASSGGVLSRLAVEFHVEWPLLAAQVLNFTVVALLLQRFAVGPLLAMLEARQNVVREGLVAAEEAGRRLADSEKSCAGKMREAALEAEKIIGDARLGAEALADEQRKSAAAQLSALRAKEMERIEEGRAVALRDARKVLRHDVVSLAAKILLEGVDEADAAKFSAKAVRAIGAMEA